jgi:fido (protein-threonine AMPylation protein)
MTDIQRANQEALNTLLQYDRMIELIRSYLNGADRFRLRPSTIQELNRISIQNVENDAGRWRDVEMLIGDSRHVPPSVNELAGYIDELCDYVNDHWDDRSALHLAAFIMWRLNWIHPFVDGNGRTTRAVSYYVLCCRLGFYIPGVTTIPELIASDKAQYYAALEAADDALKEGRGIDVSQMEGLLHGLLAKQMVEALKYAGVATSRSIRTGTPAVTQGSPTREAERAPDESQPRASTRNDLSTNMSMVFGGLGLLFFMVLILFGVQISTDSRWLVIIVFSLVTGLSFGFLGGTSNVRGSIPLNKEIEGTRFRFSVTGGIAALVLILILSWFLFIYL